MAAPDLTPSDDAQTPAAEHAESTEHVQRGEAVERTDDVERTGDGSHDAEGLAIFDDQTRDDSVEPARSSRLGVVVLVLAVVLLALDGVAIALLAADGVTAAASIALVTMLASIGVGVVALVAVATRRGRWPAVAAVLLSVLANPFVFVWLLGKLVPSL
jgi:K+-sensing histidine kinase KdpD